MFLKKLLTPLLLIQFLYAADTNDPVIKEVATQFSQALESFNTDENVKNDLEITTVELMTGLKTLDELQLEALSIIGILDSFQQPTTHADLENYVQSVLLTANTLIQANLLSIQGMNNRLPTANRNALNTSFIQIRDKCTQMLDELANPTIIKNEALSTYLKLAEIKQKNDTVKNLDLSTSQSAKQYGDTIALIHRTLMSGLQSIDGQKLSEKLQENANTANVEKAKVLSNLTALKNQLQSVNGSQSLLEPLQRMETRLTTEE